MIAHAVHFDLTSWVKESTLRNLLRDVLDLDLEPSDMAQLRQLGMPHKHTFPTGYHYNPAACIDWLSVRRVSSSFNALNQEIA